MQAFDVSYKVCVLGDAGVGKSCIIQRFADDVYNENSTSTIGIDFRYKTIEEKGKVIKMEIWDPAGSERYRSIISALFRGLRGVIYVYDVGDRTSYDNLKSYWIEQLSAKQMIHHDVLKLMVGNKSDLPQSQRAVTFEEAQAYAKQVGLPFLETSAKDGVHIEEAFRRLASAIQEGARPDRTGLAGRGGGPLNAEGTSIQLTNGDQQPQTGKKKCCID